MSAPFIFVLMERYQTCSKFLKPSESSWKGPSRSRNLQFDGGPAQSIPKATREIELHLKFFPENLYHLTSAISMLKSIEDLNP
jgi:hypothetical protein